MHFLKKLKEYFLTLDLFSKNGETNQLERRIGRIVTRSYLFIFIIILLSHIIYNAITTEVISITIYNPTQNQFENLQNRYSNNVSCPCRNIGISYESFINVTPTIHEICLSGFVSDEWRSYTTNTIDPLDRITIKYYIYSSFEIFLLRFSSHIPTRHFIR